MVIRILDHVQSFSSYEDGDRIFQLIVEPIERGEDVVLSFEGIDAVPSSFLNASILRLAERVPVAEIKAHLRLINSTKQVNDLLRSRMKFLETQSRNSP
jgi:hypothetical protein